LRKLWLEIFGCRCSWSILMTSLPFLSFGPSSFRVLWPQLTLSGSRTLFFEYGVPYRITRPASRPPRVRACSVSPSISSCTPDTFGNQDFALGCKLIHLSRASLLGSCSSDRRFAAGFLQIPPRGGHPCLKLTATIPFAVRDLHPIEHAHAGHKSSPSPIKGEGIQHFLKDGILTSSGKTPASSE